MQKIRNKKTGIPRVVPAAATHQVRIIGGQWKRTPLAVLDAQGLRPTPDRVRETVFNWLNHLLDGEWNSARCLDLFAGTGALGFEAASRGAGQVTMVESNASAVRQLEATKGKLRAEQVSILRGDALSIASRMAASADAENNRFNLIFLDPPYHQGWLEKILPICTGLLRDGGLVYAESEQVLDCETPLDWLAGWDNVRADRAGVIFYHLLRRNIPAEN
ncbi:MAG: 16S rRNA (guanine(966)-N(2))-methyltransferase RsmD [Burkholderiales bacterium RIFCSPLOWO2_02_FULL_57_36]|nr:MAG: 16S rRNA (guanine(966)-N(2))-methyltransferase RsmD [Burkholderiales bacterium RIFCSPLOWO2_02_FULL_57_36]